MTINSLRMQIQASILNQSHYFFTSYVTNILRSAGLIEDGVSDLNYPQLKLVSINKSIQKSSVNKYNIRESNGLTGVQPVHIFLDTISLQHVPFISFSRRILRYLHTNINSPLVQKFSVFGQFLPNETGKDKDGNVFPSVVAYWFAWGNLYQNTRLGT